MAQADGTIYINTAIETDGMKAGGKEVEAAARRMAKSVSGIGESARLALQKQTDSFVRQNQMYEQQRQKVETLKAKLEEMRGQKIATDEFKAVSKQIEAETAKLNKLKKMQDEFIAAGGKESSAGYRRRQIQIEELEKSIENAKREQEELLQSGKAYSPVDTGSVEEQLVRESERLIENQRRLGTSYELLKQKVSEYGGKVIQAAGSTGFFKTMFLGLIRAVQVGLAKLPLAIITGALQKLGSFARSAAAGLANLVKKSIISGFKNLASAAGRAALSLSGMNKQAKKSKNTFGKSLKTILKYTLGIRSMYILVNKIRTGIKEGFSNLAQYSGETNQSISSLMSALTQLKNSLATAFNPILTAVSPALTKLINLLSKAATYVGMFFAAFTGKKTFVKAVAVQQDYAAGLKDSASAAKEAEKANESYLSGLDEVRKFETGKDDSGKGAGGGVSPADMFETVPIENSIADMVQKIKDLIKNEDWEGLGAYMAAGINAGLQKIYDVINWDNVGPKITYFVDAFTRTFNSLVDNIDWDLMGRTIGAGINTIVNTINQISDKINWENLGKKLGEGANGLVDEIDWKNLGKALLLKLNDSIETIYGFAKEFDWDKFGTSLGEAINGAIESIDPKVWAGALSEIVKGILDTLIGFLIKTDWQEIGNKIADFIGSIDYSGIADRLFYGIGAALASLAEFIWGLIEDAWNNVVDWWKEKAYEDGEFTIQGLFDGILDSLKDIGTWIKDHIFQPFIDGFKEAFGIASPSTVMQEQGVYIMQGLFNGITSLVGKVASIFSNLKDQIIKKWEETKQKTTDTWNNIKTTLSNTWENLKSSATTKFENIKTAISQKWELVKTTTSSKWNGIKTNLSNTWENLKTSASNSFDRIKTSIINAWNNVQSSTSSTWGGISGIIKSSVNAIIRVVNRMISGIASGLNGLIGMLNKIQIPSDVPLIGGIGVNIPKIGNVPQIPYLASGAVIPPNAPFLALMGDQKHGTNLEAPESLIRKIVREETGKNHQGGGTNIIKLYLDGKQIAEAVVKQGKIEQMSSGRNMFALG